MLTSCATSPLQLICRLTVLTGGGQKLSAPTSTQVMSIPLRQRLIFALNCTPQDTLTRHHYSFQILASRPAPSDLLTTLAAILCRRQPHNVPPLHVAQAVHELLAKEYRTLESVKYELVTYTPADWVCLFEVRFSLRVQHLRQRSPQVTGSLLSRSRAFPLVFWRAWRCVSPMTVSGTAHSPWSPRQVASGALPGSSRVWSGSASCSLGIAEGGAALVRSASLDARPLALSMLLSLAPLQNVRSWKLLFLYFSHLSLNLSTDLTSHQFLVLCSTVAIWSG